MTQAQTTQLKTKEDIDKEIEKNEAQVQAMVQKRNTLLMSLGDSTTNSNKSDTTPEDNPLALYLKSLQNDKSEMSEAQKLPNPLADIFVDSDVLQDLSAAHINSMDVDAAQKTNVSHANEAYDPEDAAVSVLTDVSGSLGEKRKRQGVKKGNIASTDQAIASITEILKQHEITFADILLYVYPNIKESGVYLFIDVDKNIHVGPDSQHLSCSRDFVSSTNIEK